MKIYTNEELPQKSEQWHAVRSTRLTASRMKEVLTPGGKLSGQADALAMELCMSSEGVQDPFKFAGNVHTDWGNAHEDEARELFSALHPMWRVELPGFCLHDSAHIGGSPDGLVYEGSKLIAGLEIKCPSPQKHIAWSLAGGLPTEHAPQVHASMIVTGLMQWFFMSYFPGMQPLIVRVPADDFTVAVGRAALDFARRVEEIRPAVRQLCLPLF